MLDVRGGEIGCTYRPLAAGFALTSTLDSITVLACCAKGVQGELYELLRVDGANDLSDSDAEAIAGLEPHTFDKVMKFRFEKQPLPVGPEPIGDILLNVVIGGVICDLRPCAIKQLLHFLEPITKASLPEVTDMAYKLILEAREQARAGMELAVAKRLTINLRAIVRAPRIFITADQDMSRDTDEAAILVVDMGLLDIRSEVKEQIEDPSSLSRGELERLMYDTYPVALHGVQIVMLESLDDASAFCSRKDTTMHIIPKTTIVGCLGRRLRSNDIKLPQFKVALSMEHLKVALSDSKIYTAALLVERFLSAVQLPSPLAQLIYGINTVQCDQPMESTTPEPRQLQRLRYGSAQPTMKDLAALWADSESSEEQSQDAKSSVRQDVEEAVAGLAEANGFPTTGHDVQPHSPNDGADGAAADNSRASSVYTTPQSSPLLSNYSAKNDQIRVEAARAQQQQRTSQALIRQLDVTFSVTTVAICIAEQDKHSGRQSELLRLTLHALGLQLSTRHYDQRVNISLSGATLESLASQNTDESSESYFIFYTFPEPIRGRNVPDNSVIRAAMQVAASQESKIELATQSEEKKAFLEINMDMCDRRSPLFAELHNRTELGLDIHSTHMTVCIEQTAFIDAAKRLFPFVNTVVRRIAGIALADGSPRVHELRKQAMISAHRQHQRPARRGSEEDGSNAGRKNADGTKGPAGEEDSADVDASGPAAARGADEGAVKSMVASISLAGAHLCLAKTTEKLCALDICKLETTIVCWGWKNLG